jgi:hypothetical protein
MGARVWGAAAVAWLFACGPAAAEERTGRIGSWAVVETKDPITDARKRMGVFEFDRSSAIAVRCFDGKPSITLLSPTLNSWRIDDELELVYRLDDGEVVRTTASALGEGTAQLQDGLPFLFRARQTRKIALRVPSKGGTTHDLVAEVHGSGEAFSFVMKDCGPVIREAYLRYESERSPAVDPFAPPQGRPRPGDDFTMRPVSPVPDPPLEARPPQPPGRTVALSRAGWRLSYSSELLYVSQASDDLFDVKKQTYTTVWHSKRHGEAVVIYVQVSPNELCRSAMDYVRQQIAPRRYKTLAIRPVRDPEQKRESVILEGDGYRVGNRVLDVKTVDFVTQRWRDNSTLVHVGGRFPPEFEGLYRTEIRRMLDTMDLPESDPFQRACR